MPSSGYASRPQIVFGGFFESAVIHSNQAVIKVLTLPDSEPDSDSDSE